MYDTRQGQQARDTRYDGKENKGNLKDLKSNLYTYVRQRPVRKSHARQTSARQGSVTHARQSFAIHVRKRKKKYSGSEMSHPEDKTRKRDEKYDEKHSQK